MQFPISAVRFFLLCQYQRWRIGSQIEDRTNWDDIRATELQCPHDDCRTHYNRLKWTKCYL